MKKRYIISAIGLLGLFPALAQNDIDAMRYSQTTFGGTARFNAMGGSMGALGGDISTLSFNPAGIGLFRKSEITITPSLFSQGASATYLGTNSTDNQLKLNLENIGLVATFKVKKGNSGWESLNFAIGNNRTNDFNKQITIQGDNRTSSLLDTYVADANGHDNSTFDQFGTDLAWQTYLINPVDTNGTLQYKHVIPNYGERQTKTTSTSGKMGETFISFGGNYKSRVYVGATVGFVKTSYNEQSVYQEKDVKDTINNFNSFSFSENLNTKGNGFNFKFGVIVKATDWLRVGGSVHTPTILSLTDNYSNSMSSDLGNNGSYNASSPSGAFNYRITTPLRAMGSLGFVIGKIGLVNVDYEYVNYNAAQLSSSPNVFSDVNASIRSKYNSTGNIRAGGEIRFDPISFRLGYAFYGSPYKTTDINKDANRTSYTAGVGFRQENFFIDFAYVFTTYSEYSYLYDPSFAINSVKTDYKSNNFMLTFGLRF